MRQYRVFSSLVAFSIPARLSFIRYLSRSRLPTFVLFCRTNLQNAAPPPFGGIPSRAACSCNIMCPGREEDGVSEEYGESVEELALRVSTDVGYMRL